jgi:hypothetical protein
MLTFDMAKKCKREGRKTISTEDLFQSLQFLGDPLFSNMLLFLSNFDKSAQSHGEFQVLVYLYLTLGFI